MIIDLMRHGTPVGGRMYRGNSIDHPLSKEGWQQMHSSVGGYAQWDAIISSPLKRCVDFARELSERHQLPLQIVDDLKEIGFGCWEGKTVAEIDRQEYLDFYHDPVGHRPEGSEPLDDFINRVIQTWRTIIQQYHGQHLLCIAHAGVIRAIISHILYAEPAGLYKIEVKNGKISRIRITERSGPVLEMLNGNL